MMRFSSLPESGSRSINDLRSAIELLKDNKGQYMATNHGVDPHLELPGVYKHFSGCPVAPPTKIGPAMMFNSIKGFPEWRVLVGMMASRERCGMYLGKDPNQLAKELSLAVFDPVPPREISKDAKVPCQEEVHLASDPNFDIRTLVPAVKNTTKDAGPYFCLGLLRATNPENGDKDVTFHRICVQGKDELSIFFAPGRHIDHFRMKAEAQGKPLPISINMGLDPAIPLAASFEAPTTPIGFDELGVAGALRNTPVELANCITVKEQCLARAEVVIEAELLPDIRMREDEFSRTGYAMPELHGYNGHANPSLPVAKVKAVTTRHNPILQTLAGPGEEHVSLVGLPTEASIYAACNKSVPGLVTNVYASSAGGGKFLIILQVKRRSERDTGKARHAALVALGAYSETKNIILVDDDVDIFDHTDVMWAMMTRMQGDKDITNIPCIDGHVLDPSQSPDFSPVLPFRGSTCKTIYDCTYPWELRDRFARAKFEDVDVTPFLNNLEK